MFAARAHEARARKLKSEVTKTIVKTSVLRSTLSGDPHTEGVIRFSPSSAARFLSLFAISTARVTFATSRLRATTATRRAAIRRVGYTLEPQLNPNSLLNEFSPSSCDSKDQADYTEADASRCASPSSPASPAANHSSSCAGEGGGAHSGLVAPLLSTLPTPLTKSPWSIKR